MPRPKKVEKHEDLTLPAGFTIVNRMGTWVLMQEIEGKKKPVRKLLAQSDAGRSRESLIFIADQRKSTQRRK